MSNHNINPETFSRASRLIRINTSLHGCCKALRRADAGTAEKALFRRMHKPRLMANHEHWFGNTYVSDNQRYRKAILAEIGLNLRAQGFSK